MDILDSVFLHIVYGSFTGSILILLVLSVKQVFKHRLGARLHHVLWILVFVRLLMPAVFESPFSVFNLIDLRAHLFPGSQAVNVVSGAFSFTEDYTGNEPEKESPGPSPERAIHAAVKAEALPDPFILQVFSRIWLAGVLFLTLFSCVVTIKFKGRTKVLKRAADPVLQALAEQCSQRAKLKKRIPVYVAPHFKSPCISGVLRPAIYLPEGITTRVGQQELRHILLHELAHYKRKDLFYSFLATLAALLHWFNPLVWLAVKKMRLDREIACDASVMEMLGEEERVSYGTTIIHVANLFANGHKQLNLAGFYETNSQLERRISMISMFKKGSYRISAIAVICCMAIGAVVFTDAVGAGGEKNNVGSRLKEKSVLIDPGHGGEDPGAVYPLATTDTAAAQIKEKDLNLEISLMLYDLLRESGVRVALTRYEDLTLELADRVEMANSLAPSLFIGIHHNAAPDPSEKGTLTMFNPARDYAAYGITGEKAARLLQEEMVGKLETADGGLREMGNSKVLSETEMPSVIAEIAYMTNESDRQKLMTEEFRKTAAQALHDGILKVLLAMEEKA